MGMIKYSQSSQNGKFAVTLQHLKKEVRDEVDFLLAYECQSLLQVDFNTLDKKVYLYDISKKEIVIKLFNKKITSKIFLV